MPEEKAPDNSRQSVDLKWKSRKGIEENLSFEGSKTEVGGDLEIDGKVIANSGVVDNDGKEKYITTEIGLENAQDIFGDKTNASSFKGLKGTKGTLSVVNYDYGMGIIFTPNGYTNGLSLQFEAWPGSIAAVRIPHDRSGVIALRNDISPLYRHSVTLSDASASMAVFDFYSSDSAPLTSASALYAALNGQQVACNGAKSANGSLDGDSFVIALKFGATKAASQGLILGTGAYVSFTQIFAAEGEPAVKDSVSTVIAPVANAKEDPWPEEEEAKGNAFPEEEEASPKAKKAVK